MIKKCSKIVTFSDIAGTLDEPGQVLTTNQKNLPLKDVSNSPNVSPHNVEKMPASKKSLPKVKTVENIQNPHPRNRMNENLPEAIGNLKLYSK